MHLQREEDMDMEGAGPTVADLQQDAAAKLRAYESASKRGGTTITPQQGMWMNCKTLEQLPMGLG